jgi:hypothetical protein
MRIPPVSERVKEAPAHALRAVFAGIGQLLLVTDRLKNKPGEEDQVPRPRQPEPSGPATEAAAPAPAQSAAPPAAAPPAAASSAAAPAGEAPPAPEAPAAPAPTAAQPAAPNGGNVRLLPDTEDAPAAPEVAETPSVTPPDGTPVAEAPTAPEAPTATETTATEAPAAEAPAGAEPPIANYDQLSLASLRARLRGLTLVQVRELIVYEQANAARPDVIAMYERRVTKLESPEG